MENLKKSTQTFSCLNEMDFNFRKLVGEFSLTLSPAYKAKIVILKHLYESCLKDKKLISKIDGSLLILNITIEHIFKFQNEIENKVYKNIISKNYANNILYYVNKFLKFLSSKNIVHIFYKPKNFFKSNVEIKNKNMDPLLSNFMNFLNTRDYSHHNCIMKSVKRFLKFSNYTTDLAYNTDFWDTSIKKYEEFLRIQVSKEKLAASSAYAYLKKIRILYIFLFEEKIITFKYKIPRSFIINGNRRNLFVTVEEILHLCEEILKNSKNSARDISILLILVETGCRPIEIANLEIDDLVLHERLIILKSKKSHQRTVKISSDLINLIKDYLKIRSNYLSEDSNFKSLFVTRDGFPISSANISTRIRRYHLTPNSLRHTFITNALNNKNDIEEVAKIVGHKNLTVTLGYFYRNLESIKQLAIDKELNLGKADK